MYRLIRYLKRHRKKSIVIFVLLILYYFCLPKELFSDPTATVITSKSNQLLGAQIASDGQWRFPHNDSIPEKFKTCIIQFEDEYFYSHPGFNPISIVKALKENISSGEVKRGGSTLTQQVIRLSRKGRSRTYVEKFKEIILASRLEFRESKATILAYYSSNAPFGGNVVGLDAAAWRYFNRDAHQLSWAESATLAVLPNAPSLIYPGKNQERLLEKRNRLLKKLLDNEIIDELTYSLSIVEPLPQKPYPLPQIAPHLLQKINKTHKGEFVKTTINKDLQERVNHIVKTHYNILKQNEIHNAAVFVMDVRTREVLAYVGNTPTDNAHHKDVDIIDKPRSTGSILKPFLFASMLDSGDILPNTLITDVPSQFGNYTPENFNKNYDGVVPASRALARSLNVPSVRMLRSFGLDRFHGYLKQLELKDLKHSANHYGLSLILGGAESNLWDLCKGYAALSSTLNHYSETSSEYFTNEIVEPIYLASESVNFGSISQDKVVFDAASIYLTYDSLKKVNRPEGDENWEFFDASKEVAWKTGTSFGFRDAWAIGTTSNYVVGVWVGNADGEGRPGLIGVQTAGPILFDVFDLLPKSPWFDKPFDEMEEVAICVNSGHRASSICDETTLSYIQKSGLKTEACPYHITVHLDKNEQFQVNSSCESIEEMIHKPWFVLAPIKAYYYKLKNPFYKDLPNLRDDCSGEEVLSMDFIYPKEENSIFLPKDFDGDKNSLILKVAHSRMNTKIYWYINDKYLGLTKDIHEFEILPGEGKHKITIVDEFGNELTRSISISE
ncbi:penicillin-binding protein 1C [Psychroserpens sp.]|uniref:penicillin-binding protein 1C n=1 Tax=Psychroserpens sp. TaxID=2020870 RepID=UPI001B117152|nr:penicillin-binding protein 1C [Psychroserpens sp.]MBO6607679.1 penicillin-binding protein 1C [Psychroserpens sp.]MBO6654670.1 penicillin-binding protein 1C [Psychroserpens sp.]MBO6682906.1 penicillin-binding protein 1C [Psychroserpens sp.]MBO6751037.1 penicillin-binding protein 1C [Psychroserpens sp.]MBO6916394.1 penicillin-binding protein 1C [Psychroserpens sp.]